jgi:hypothetical protein
MKILIACEFSGIVRDAFIAKGHDAVSCDLLPTERPGPHIQGDVLEHLDEGWDMMIAHPPCTRLCNSGVCWLEKRNLWDDMRQAALFFKKFLDCKIKRKAIENPIPHKYALQVIGRKYDQILQPWQFGHGETKATCLWLEELPPLMATNIVTGREQRLHRLPPSKDRAKLRSTTFQGVAAAMAEQWGCVV